MHAWITVCVKVDMQISRILEGNVVCTYVKPADLCGQGSRKDTKTAGEGIRL